MTTPSAVQKALKRMLDAFYDDPLGNDQSGAIEEAQEALAMAAPIVGDEREAFEAHFATLRHVNKIKEEQWEGCQARALHSTPVQPIAHGELIEALTFYAEGHHFTKHDPDAWDTVSGEPANFEEDEACTATVEDGSIAKMALAGISAAVSQDRPAQDSDAPMQPVNSQQVEAWLSDWAGLKGLSFDQHDPSDIPLTRCTINKDASDAQDSARLDHLEAAMRAGEMLNYHKKHFSLKGFTNYEYSVFKTVREAIDASLQGKEVK